MRRFTAVVWLLLSLLALPAGAAITVDAGQARQRIGAAVDILADPDERYRVEELAAGVAADAFVNHGEAVPLFPRVRGTYWARIALYNPSTAPVVRDLVVEFPNYRRIVFHAPTDHGFRARVSDLADGDRDTDIRYRYPAYRIELAPGETRTYYLGISHHMVRFALSLWDPEALDHFALDEFWLQGLLLGILVCALTYQLALALLAREREHWSLFLCIAATILMVATMLGYPQLFLGSFGAWLSRAYFAIVLVFSGAIVLFGRHFLELEALAPVIDRVLKGCDRACFVLAGVSLAAPREVDMVFPVVLLVGVSLLVFATARLVRRRNRFALLFAVSLLPLVLIGALATAINQGLLPVFDHYHSIVAANFAVGILMFAFSSAYRIGRRREERQRMALAAQRAEEVAQAHMNFLATMSHEVRTPLNAISGMLELLGRQPVSLEQRRYLRIAGESADALLAQMNQILDFARLDSDAVPLREGDFSLPELLQACLDAAVLRRQGDGVRLRLEIAPEVPVGIRADRDKLRQIVTNFLDNALKFTAEGAVTLSAGIVDRDGETLTLRLAVTDTGIGVPEDARERIFGRFEQADNSIGRRYGGVGLGLAICRALVRRLGGTLGFDSVVGQGSTFWSHLPVRAAAVSLAARPASPTAAPGRPLRVLVADDNAVNREITEVLLGADGHTVVCVEDGAQALAAVQESGLRDGQERTPRFDCVLMDISMPVMDGHEATRRIRALADSRQRAVRIVALTAHAFPESIQACLDAGADAVITKPIRPGELAQALHAADRPLADDGPPRAPAPAVAADSDATDAPADAEPWLDEQIYATNVGLLGEPRMREYLGRQAVDTATAVQAMKAHLADAEHEALARAAHQLAGACAFLGLVRLRQCASALEQAVRGGDTAALDNHLRRLEAAALATETGLRAVGVGA